MMGKQTWMVYFLLLYFFSETASYVTVSDLLKEEWVPSTGRAESNGKYLRDQSFAERDSVQMCSEVQEEDLPESLNGSYVIKLCMGSNSQIFGIIRYVCMNGIWENTTDCYTAETCNQSLNTKDSFSTLNINVDNGGNVTWAVALGRQALGTFEARQSKSAEYLKCGAVDIATDKQNCYLLYDSYGGWAGTGNMSSNTSILFFSASPSLIFIGGQVTVNGSSESTSIGLITYIGVGISIPCLLITLIAEAMIWKSITETDTTYMRHVCLVNITVSLLLADIWFLIYIVLLYFPNPKLYLFDLAANILIFLFYLCFSFWILVIGLFLFYRVIFVLHNMSRRAMLTAAFSVGYGCPILISTILVTSVVPREAFTSGNYTWFDTDRTKAVVSFLAPVMSISFLNLIILLVVIYKIIRSPKGVKRRVSSRRILIQIISIIAVLTPVSSITWGISLGMLLDKNSLFLQNLYFAFHALQGVFIMLFNVLPNKRVRKALRALCGNCLPSKQESQTVIESLKALCGLLSKQESQTDTDRI